MGVMSPFEVGELLQPPPYSFIDFRSLYWEKGGMSPFEGGELL